MDSQRGGILLLSHIPKSRNERSFIDSIVAAMTNLEGGFRPAMGDHFPRIEDIVGNEENGDQN
jgi:hypothetical protein